MGKYYCICHDNTCHSHSCMKSHNGYDIPYWLGRPFCSRLVLKFFEEKPERESPKRTISAIGRLGLLQLTLLCINIQLSSKIVE